MKVDSEKVNGCQLKVTIKLEAEETRPVYDKVFRVYVQQGRIPGFRPGKAPREMILRAFQSSIIKDTQERIVGEFCRKALDEQKITPLAITELTEMIFTPETGATFSVMVDVKPEFDLPKYKKVSIECKEPEVTDEQVAERLAMQRKAFAKFEDEVADDYAAALDDLVQIDFDATIGGKPLVETAPDAAALSSGKDFWMMMDPSRFLKEVVEGIVGMKKGESKDVKVAFPKDVPVEALRGKKAVFAVTLKKVRQCVLPDDATFISQMKSDSMEALVANTKQAMLDAEIAAENNRRNEAVADALLKKQEFDLPQSQLDEETNRVLDQMMNMAQYRGVSKEVIESGREQILAQAIQGAKRNLRLRYILAGIAEAEKIEVPEEDYLERVTNLASDFQIPAEELKARFAADSREKLLKDQLRNEKALQFVLDIAKGK